MIEIRLKGWWRDKVFFLKEKWEELTAEEFAAVSDILFSAGGDKLKTDISLLKILAAMKPHHLLFMKAENVLPLLPLCDWVLKEANIIKQLIPSFHIAGKNYYGPYDGLQNLRNNEFESAEQELGVWHDLYAGEQEGNIWQDEKALYSLYRFAAILYRPARKKYDLKRDPEGDRREKYNQFMVDERAKLFQQYLPVGYLKAIMIWYKGCRAAMYEQFTDVFTQNEGGEPESSDAYFGMMRAIAEKGTYGTFDQVEEMWIWTMLTELRAAKKDIDRQKEALEKTKH